MDLWKAHILITKNDIYQRALFRFVWCNVGTTVVALICTAIRFFFQQITPYIWLAVFISFVGSIIVTAIGFFLDSRELDKKWKDISNR